MKNETRRPAGLLALATLTVALACGSGGAEDAAPAAADPGGAAPGQSEPGQAQSQSTHSQSIPTSMLSPEGTNAVPPAQEFQLSEIGFDYGSDDAPIKVVEFSDYGCGYCRRFHTETFPTLLQDFIERGRVQWKYVTYVSGMFPNGMTAAFAAECAGEQELFPAMSPLLYERQGDWKGLQDPYDAFEAMATEVGANSEQFRTCYEEQRPRPRVRSGIISGARLGVRGTPSFLINGVPAMGAQPLVWWDGLFSAIEEEGGGDPLDGDPSGGAAR